MKLTTKYKGFSMIEIKDGKTCLLWDDLWNGGVPKLQFPELYSFTKKKSITIQEAKELSQLHTIFHLPLSEEAFAQYENLLDNLNNLATTDSKDIWRYIWGSNHFSSRKVYKHLRGHMPEHPIFGWLWKSSF